MESREVEKLASDGTRMERLEVPARDERDARDDPRDPARAAAWRADRGVGGAPEGSCSTRPIVSSTPSASERLASSLTSWGCRPLVMRKTPKKVNRQPPTNLTACSPVVRSKSR